MIATLFPQRLRHAYRARMVTDMSFRATVIGVKVLLVAAAMLAVLAFAYAEKSSEPGAATPNQTFLGLHNGQS
jgi:hypothetical protein